MNSTTRDKRLPKALLVGSIAAGLAAGSYGIASAAGNDSGAGSSESPSGTTSARPAPPGHGGPGGGAPGGGQRSDETALTGDTASKVEAAAKAKVPGGTVVRVETDADGHAKYEAHMTDADGAPVTVYVDDGFDVVSVERR
jgi:hypothetical protein